MPFDTGVAQRVREALVDQAGVVEKKMFGGIAFMLRGNMCCGVSGDELMVRVGRVGHEAALARPHARKMDFTGKSLKGFIFVAPPGFAQDDELEHWVKTATDFALSLPAK